MFTVIHSYAGLDNPHPRPAPRPMGDMERQAHRIRPAGQGHTGLLAACPGAVERLRIDNEEPF